MNDGGETVDQPAVWRFRTIASAACALLLVGCFGARAAAQEHGDEHPSQPGAAEHGEEHAEHKFHRHHFSVFIGGTDGPIEKEIEVGAESEGNIVLKKDQTAFTVGLDYEYRLSRLWGIGALIDYAGKDLRSWVAGIPLVLHPHGGWKLLVAPGVEDREDEDTEFLVRAGILYDFEVGRFTVAPAVQVDFVDGEEILVYGVNIGKGF